MVIKYKLLNVMKEKLLITKPMKDKLEDLIKLIKRFVVSPHLEISGRSRAPKPVYPAISQKSSLSTQFLGTQLIDKMVI